MASLLLTQRKFARAKTFFKMTSYVAIYITISFCLSLGLWYDVLHYGITKGFSKSKEKDLYHKGKWWNRTPPLVAEIYHCIFCMSNRRQTHHSPMPCIWEGRQRRSWTWCNTDRILKHIQSPIYHSNICWGGRLKQKEEPKMRLVYLSILSISPFLFCHQCFLRFPVFV